MNSMLAREGQLRRALLQADRGRGGRRGRGFDARPSLWETNENGFESLNQMRLARAGRLYFDRESMTPDHATLILKSVGLPSLQAEHPVTRSVIAAIPADKVDYRPDSIARSAIDLAWHIVTAENRFLEAVVSGAFDLTPRPRPDAVRAAADVNAWYEERFAGNVGRLKGVSGEQLLKRIDFRGLFQFPAVVYVQIALSHSVHHRGQLSMYLRPMGAKVPSIYGESYDARMAREAAQA